MMEEFAKKAVLLSLLQKMADEGSWSGETHLQKTVFFLQCGLDVPFEFDFILYKHGPFSFDLREELGDMRGRFLIDLRNRGNWGASIIVDESGEKLIASFPRAIARYDTKLTFVAREFAAHDVGWLERVGTALYVRNKFPDATEVERASKLHDLKPHVDLDAAMEATTTIDGLLLRASALDGDNS